MTTRPKFSNVPSLLEPRRRRLLVQRELVNAGGIRTRIKKHPHTQTRISNWSVARWGGNFWEKEEAGIEKRDKSPSRRSSYFSWTKTWRISSRTAWSHETRQPARFEGVKTCIWFRALLETRWVDPIPEGDIWPRLIYTPWQPEVVLKVMCMQPFERITGWLWIVWISYSF